MARKLGEGFIGVGFELAANAAAQLQAKIKALLTGVKAEVPVTANVKGAVADIATLRAAITALARATSQIKIDVNDAAAVSKLAELRVLVAALGLMSKKLDITTDVNSAPFTKLAGALAQAEVMYIGLKNASASSKKALADAAAGADEAGAAAQRWGFNLRILGNQLPLFAGLLSGIPLLRTITLFHLLADVAVETAAVVIPAGIALAAWGAGAVPVMRDIYSQMSRIYTVAQALGKSTLPGLAPPLLALENAVKPSVWVLFGEAINTVNKNTGFFVTLAKGAGTVLDQLGARAEQALSSGGLNKFVADGVRDLSILGNTIGNVFGILGNLLKTMPQYAEILARALQLVTGALEAITGSGIVQGAIKIGLAFHGAAIYGGLLATAVGALGIPLGAIAARMANVGGSFESASSKLDKNAGIVQKIKAGWSDLGNAIPVLGANIAGLGKDAEEAGGKFSVMTAGTNLWKGALSLLTKVPVWGWVALGAAALGGFVYWLSQSKDATQQWYSATEQAIGAQVNLTGVVNTTRNAVEYANAQVAKTPQTVQAIGGVLNRYAGSLTQVNTQYGEWVSNAQSLGAQQKLEGARLDQLKGLFGSTADAQAALNAVGIKASDIANASAQAWAQDITELNAYKTATVTLAGFQSGQALAAQNALTFAQNEQQQAISKVVSAQDSLISIVTGSEQAYNTFVQGNAVLAQNFDQVAGKGASVNLTLGRLRGSVAIAGAAMGGTSAASAALSQAFYDQITNAQKLNDALEQQQATSTQIKDAVATEAKGLLVYAGNNLAARSAVIDLVNNALGPGTVSFKNLDKWVTQNSVSQQGFKNAVDKSTIAAGNLAGTLKDNLNKIFQDTILKASGASGAMAAYTTDLVNNQEQTQRGRTDRQNLINDLVKAGLSAQDATDYVNGLQKQIDGMHGKAVTVGVNAFASGVITAAENTGGFPGLSAIKASLHFGAAGMKVPGHGSGDTVPAMLTPGEAVVPRHLVPAVTPFLKANRVPGFASGGLVPGPAATTAGFNAAAAVGPTAQAFVGAVAGQFAQQAGVGFGKQIAAAFQQSITSAAGSGAQLLDLALQYVGRVPYVWGGDTPAGWDCSGMVSWLMDQLGLFHGRTTAAGLQAWAKPSQEQPGALVFFGNPAYHVGIVDKPNSMVSALGTQWGTTISSLAGNSGFGIPPQGFGGSGVGTSGFAGGSAYWINIGREMAARPPYGWTGAEFADLAFLWDRESGWNPNARNPSSGAAGIPQDITGNFHGGGVGQIAWGLAYILGKYGSPAAAWAHEVSQGWYGSGGLVPGGNWGWGGGMVADHGALLRPGLNLLNNKTGRNEHLTPAGPSVTVNVYVQPGAVLNSPRQAGRVIADLLKEYVNGGGTLVASGVRH